MKYVWETGDIIPGRGVLKPKISNKNQMKAYLIAYTHGRFVGKEEDERYFLIAVDEDGMSLTPHTQEGLAEFLTDLEVIPVDVRVPSKSNGNVDGYGKFEELKEAFLTLDRLR